MVTHVHADHLNHEHLAQIARQNPGVTIFAAKDVAEQAPNLPITTVTAGDTKRSGNFKLHFSGDLHQTIHKTAPRPHNIAVTVNDGALFYPGDSYTMPQKPVNALAVPANGPWMKVADSMDYITAVKPRICFPTHNGLLSDAGNTVYNNWLRNAADNASVDFRFLLPGDSVEVKA